MVGSAARVGRRRQRLGQPAGHEQRREDAVGQRAQLLDGVLHVALDLVDHRDGVVRVVLDGVTGQAQLHGQRDEVLLGAVVQVALELAPLGVAGGDDAGPRLLQLVVADLQLVEARLQRGVELHVVQGQGRPGGRAR